MVIEKRMRLWVFSFLEGRWWFVVWGFFVLMFWLMRWLRVFVRFWFEVVARMMKRSLRRGGWFFDFMRIIVTGKQIGRAHV